MTQVRKETTGKITLFLLLALCLGFSSTLFAAQNNEIEDEKKEDMGDNGPEANQNNQQPKPIIPLQNDQNLQAQIVSDWACPKCTFANKATSKCCVQCGTSKPLDNKHAIWTCVVCTLENSIDNTKCATCGNPHPLAMIQHDNHKLAEYSPIDVKFMDYVVEKDNKKPVVSYKFKVMYNHSACNISCTDLFLRALHQDIIKTCKINDKSLVLPLENISTNYVKQGPQLQSYLLSLFKHEKTDHEEILRKLGMWYCDICKILNDINNKCLKCKSKKIIINIREFIPSKKLNPFSISIAYANRISLNDVLDKAIQYINDRKDKDYYIDYIGGYNSFIKGAASNKIGPTDNHEWDEFVNQKITTWDQDKIIEKGLEISITNRYHHSPKATKISCKYIKEAHQSKYSGLGLALQCPIYRNAKKHGKFSKEVLNHLYFATHFLDEYQEKEVCKYGAKCESFTRLAHNGHLIKDLCHIKLYRHPPRSNRQIQLNKDIHKFICNQNENDNQPLYKLNDNEKENIFCLLLDEVIRNGYQYDLCLICKKRDKCNHDVYNKNDKHNLVSRVKDRFNHPRYKKMGRPFHEPKRIYGLDAPGALMLSLLLYTGGDSSYDLCNSQRNGNYLRWKIFDCCLAHAISYLSEQEYGAYRLYSGLQKTKLSTTVVRSGYFPTYTSTTLYKDIAKKFIETEGMILEIDPAVRNRFICCDVSWISKFKDEYEIIVARTIKKLFREDPNAFFVKILDDKNGLQTVLLTTNHADVIPKITYMLKGLHSLHKATPSDMLVFKKLINRALPHMQKRWDELSWQQYYITINMEDMYDYYKAFSPLLFDPKCKNLLLFDKIIETFPNVTKITCRDTDCIGKYTYSPSIICSDFILRIKDMLHKIAQNKHHQLKKIIIQTDSYEIEDSCKLYTAQFKHLGWHIGKGSKTIVLTKNLYDYFKNNFLPKIESIIQGQQLISKEVISSLDVPILNKLIAGAKNVSIDMQQAWDEFRRKQESIAIVLADMYKYYKAFSTLLFDPKCKNLLLFDKIIETFPNVTKIICTMTDCIKVGSLDSKYSSAIVGSNFILRVKDRLHKMDKHAKLTKIVIQTWEYEIGDDCKLHAPQFGALGWHIGKESKAIVLTKRPYSDFIAKIKSMIGGNGLKNDAVTFLDIPILNKLISRSNDDPSDVPKIWSEFSNKAQGITIGMRYMYEDYKALMPLLFDPKCTNLLLFDKIAQLFPNATEVICKDTDYIRYDENNKYVGYLSSIVCSNFMPGLKDRLHKIDKHAKLKKIIIQTNRYEIEDNCKLYTAQFSALGWKIQRESYENTWGSAKRNNQITLTRLTKPNASSNYPPAQADTNEQKLNDYQSEDEVFDID